MQRCLASATVSHSPMKMIGDFTSLQSVILQKKKKMPLLFCITPSFLFEHFASAENPLRCRCGKCPSHAPKKLPVILYRVIELLRLEKTSQIPKPNPSLPHHAH